MKSQTFGKLGDARKKIFFKPEKLLCPLNQDTTSEDNLYECKFYLLSKYM